MYLACKALEREHLLAALRVPHPHGTVSTARGDACAIGAVSDTAHRAPMALEGEQELAVPTVPDFQRPVAACCDHAITVRAHAHSRHIACVSVEEPLLVIPAS